MISWIIRLCALCSMSALMQMIVGNDAAKGALKTICGLLMLHMTCESAQQMMQEMACGDLMQMMSWLVK
ncbi:MAG: hypothetical protein IKU34_08985 [Clostridia bacterium]|nr:hypothetical protein [Clostridia bacterium]